MSTEEAVNVPAVLEEVYSNSISLLTADTVNVPLNPLLAVPTVLSELFTFLTMIWSLTFKLWGISARTVTVPELYEQVDINLKLWLNPPYPSTAVASEGSIVTAVPAGTIASVPLRYPVLLDSWIINPDSGVFPLVDSFGTTTLNL